MAGGVGRQSRKGESNRLPAVARHTFKTHSTRNCTVKYSIHADESPEGRHGPRRRRASDNDPGIAGTVPRGGAGAQAVSHPENHPADRPQSSRKRFRTRANSGVAWRNPACLSSAVNPRSSFSRRAFGISGESHCLFAGTLRSTGVDGPAAAFLREDVLNIPLVRPVILRCRIPFEL